MRQVPIKIGLNVEVRSDSLQYRHYKYIHLFFDMEMHSSIQIKSVSCTFGYLSIYIYI